MKKSHYTLQQVGDILKEKREEKGVSIKQASKELRIREKFLNAMEESNYDVFDSEVYIKGFLRNYSNFLGLNSERIIRLYRRERESSLESPVFQDFGENRIKKKFDFSLMLNTKDGIIGTSVFVILIALGFFIIRLYLYSRKPVLVLNEPFYADSYENLEYTYDTSGGDVTFKGVIGIGNSLYLNKERVETFGREKFETPSQSLVEGTSIFELSTKNQFGVESKLIINVLKKSAE